MRSPDRDGRPPVARGAPVKAGNPYFSNWAEQYSIPCMILAEDLGLLWSNSAADGILAAAKDFQLTNGALACVDKVQGQAFRGFLATVGQTPEAWIYCQNDTASQMVRAESLSPEGMPSAVALMIYPIDRAGRYFWSDFHKVFGLTRAETIIVKRIIGGEPADTIAEELSITLETVRTHVRRVYAKLAVNNREQLFSKVSAFRIL
jgi:DNA-binding CsgD family transcriptional regulator